MVIIFFLLPFLVVIITALVLFNAGSTLKEKVLLFFITPPGVDKENMNLISIIRFLFWGSLAVSIWAMTTIIGPRHRL